MDLTRKIYKLALIASFVIAAESFHRKLGLSHQVRLFSTEMETFDRCYRGILQDWILDRLPTIGYDFPTKIQKLSIEAGQIEGQDAVIHSQTGSGKTLAYLLPLLNGIDPSRSCVQALVIVPSRELGLQVARVAKKLAVGHNSIASKRILVMSLLSGSNLTRQKAWASAEAPQIVVGEAKAMVDFFKRGKLSTSSIKYVVVDEIDYCLADNVGGRILHLLLSNILSPTFGEDGKSVSANSKFRGRPGLRQTVLVSATIPQHNYFIKQCVSRKWTLRDPVHLYTSAKNPLPNTVSHFYANCRTEKNRLPALRKILRLLHNDTAADKLRILCFLDDDRPLKKIAHVITDDLNENTSSGEAVTCLTADDNLAQRANALNHFANGDSCILITNNICSRGLDLPDTNIVILFDTPDDHTEYLHKAGRTGRLGRKGSVITIVTNSQLFLVEKWKNVWGIEIKRFAGTSNHSETS